MHRNRKVVAVLSEIAKILRVDAVISQIVKPEPHKCMQTSEALHLDKQTVFIQVVHVPLK